MQTYRTRSRTFQALHFSGDNPAEVIDELFDMGYVARWHETPCQIHDPNIGDHIVVDAPRTEKSNGHWLVKSGDWIIFDEGRITTCRTGMFMRLYEVA